MWRGAPVLVSNSATHFDMMSMSVFSNRPMAVKFALVFALAALVGCTPRNVLSVAPYEPPTQRYAAIVVNANSGEVLHETRADAIRFPASLTKMMTLHIIFDEMKRHAITKNTLIPVSAKAAARPASKLWLKPNSTITVDEAIQALAIKSANDVAYAVAEFFSGSKAAFARRMTRRARELGLKSTVFRNASGLPDKGQVTTARDMARLGVSLKKRHARHFHYFSRNSFVFRGKTIRGHNRVLGRLNGANGIKTGYTRASGYNLITSVSRSGKTIVGVILGEDSGRLRDQHMVQLLEAIMPRAGIR